MNDRVHEALGKRCGRHRSGPSAHRPHRRWHEVHHGTRRPRIEQRTAHFFLSSLENSRHGAVAVASMNHPVADVISTNESAFILKALEAGTRVDGRRRLETRKLHLVFGEELGHVEVHLGQTKVFAVATAELVEPYLDRPAEGLLHFHAEYSPMASQIFEGGRPTEAAVELMRLLERTLRKSQAIDIEALCVVASKRVWSIRCDVTVLDQRGNICDCAVLAALAALKHLRIPAVSIVGTGDEATIKVLTRAQAEPQPLVFHHLPVAVTFGLFRGADGRSIFMAVDPTDREELIMPGNIVVVLNQFDEVCGLHKPGGLPIEASQALECVRQAALITPTILSALESALDEQLLKLTEEAKALSKTGRLPVRQHTTGQQQVVSVCVPPGGNEGGNELKLSASADSASAPCEGDEAVTNKKQRV